MENGTDKVIGFRLAETTFTEFKEFMESHDLTVSQGIRRAIKSALADRVKFMLDGEPAP